MKQLLSVSKKRKEDNKKNSIKSLLLNDPENQEDNFIYEENSDRDSDNVNSPGSQPTETEILFYADTLGIKLPEEQDLLYIARQCLNAQMPPNWHCQTDEQGQIIYINKKTGQIKFQHPSDEQYRQKVILERKKKIQNLMKGVTKINVPKSKTSFIQNAFKQKSEVKENQQKKLKPLEQRKDLSDLISEGMKNKDSKERKQSIKENAVKQNKNISKLELDIEISNRKQNKYDGDNQKSDFHVNLSGLNKKPSLALEQKRKQIEQKVQRKYKQMKVLEERKYIEKLKQMREKEEKIKNTDIYDLKQIIGQSVIERRRKETEMKLMMEHASRIGAKRLQAQKQYRKQLIFLGSKYQIDQLFTQMGQCRKFISRQKQEGQKSKYLQEMSGNMRIINQIQIEKIVASIENDSRNIMHQLLNSIVRQGSGNKIDWEKQYKIMNQFNEALGQIVKKYQKQEKHSVVTENIEDQPDLMKQSQVLYEQMANLKKKLRELQEESNTQRSNLSDKQSKLVDLLQNRASSSARSSQQS